MTYYQAQQKIGTYVTLVRRGEVIGRYKLAMVHKDGDAFLLDRYTGDWFHVYLADIKAA